MFGFYVNTSAPRLQLPTKKFPLEFSVIETKTNLNVAMGIGVGVVLALLLLSCSAVPVVWRMRGGSLAPLNRFPFSSSISSGDLRLTSRYAESSAPCAAGSAAGSCPSSGLAPLATVFRVRVSEAARALLRSDPTSSPLDSQTCGLTIVRRCVLATC